MLCQCATDRSRVIFDENSRGYDASERWFYRPYDPCNIGKRTGGFLTHFVLKFIIDLTSKSIVLGTNYRQTHTQSILSSLRVQNTNRFSPASVIPLCSWYNTIYMIFCEHGQSTDTQRASLFIYFKYFKSLARSVTRSKCAVTVCMQAVDIITWLSRDLCAHGQSIDTHTQ